MSPACLTPLAFTVLLMGCTSADVLRLDNSPRPQTRPESVQLIGQEPQQPYTVIALVQARREWPRGQARDRLVKEAAKLGGDAVLLDFESMRHGDSQITGKVIVFDRTSRSN